MMTEDNTPT